jgi:hypothetical protein
MWEGVLRMERYRACTPGREATRFRVEIETLREKALVEQEEVRILLAQNLQAAILTRSMGSLKKRRKAKINKHKRRKKLRAHRHKKRTWQK